MIKEFKKSIGYICPFCSTITVRDVNLFDFSGNGVTRFMCKSDSCNQTAVSITPKKDKYSITVDCPICGEPHHFNITKITFWKNEYFVLHCPESGFGILFVGTYEKIHQEIDAQEKLLAEIEDEFMIDEDVSKLFDTVEHINEIAKNDAIYCVCGSRKIGIEIGNDGITLTCRDCGKKKTISTDAESIEKLLNASTIVLD